ncbi:MAG: zinc-finger domain-containing protein [Burkholderiaceae bacterium]|nr:MAG: zinc-finger domain-containing protein [Burkholderiaceae bacterium]
MTQPKAVIEVLASETQGPGVVFCPNPRQTLWNQHPKVYVDLSHTGEGTCPYCGTVYKLKERETLGGHH